MGERYKLNSEMKYKDLDIKGKNIYDISIGASILSKYRNIPIFFNVNVSNLLDGFKKIIFKYGSKIYRHD